MGQAYTVTEINQYIKNMFIKDPYLNHIYVKGEVSNCKYHTSGHIYFTLKDSQGQLTCVMFAGQRRGLTFRMEEGQSVIILGSISVYERDGKYQLYANQIILDGLGVLYERFEKLKKDLEAEGLFDRTRKKAIPPYPKQVGIVTASTGAAIQDIVNISKRRNPYVQLILYPALVQGAGASDSIVKGIKALDKLKPDVIIIGRGGGSIEDLWAFNEEAVARAIHAASTPIISAVGHETDVTIADYVADLRAPTPSAAAELAVNDYISFTNLWQDYKRRIFKLTTGNITHHQSKLRELKLRLFYASPSYQIKQKRQQLMDIEQKLTHHIDRRLKDAHHRLELYVTKLEGLSPLAKLKKGYSLVRGEDGLPLSTINKVNKGDELIISLIDGEIVSRVLDTKELIREYN